jgi:hypothetical protein
VEPEKIESVLNTLDFFRYYQIPLVTIVIEVAKLFDVFTDSIHLCTDGFHTQRLLFRAAGDGVHGTSTDDPNPQIPLCGDVRLGGYPARHHWPSIFRVFSVFMLRQFFAGCPGMGGRR